MKWLLRGMAKRKEILSEIGPRPKYIIDAFNTLQSIKQKRKEMSTPTNTQPFQWSETTALLFVGFYLSSRERGETDGTKIIADFKERLRPHSTVTEERRDGWEIVSVKDNYYKDNGIITESRRLVTIPFIKYVDGSAYPKDRFSIYSVRRLSDGEVFVLDQWVASKHKDKLKISGFFIENDNMIATFEGIQIPCDIYWLSKLAAPIPEEPKPVVKPPIGIIPEWLWKERRLFELTETIELYEKTNQNVPAEWRKEVLGLRSWWYDYKHPKKEAPQEKPVLFVTVDNVAIREGDTYWTVCDNWKIWRTELARLPLDAATKRSFSTVDAANEYILLNKPCFSAAEIETWVRSKLRGFYKEDSDQLKELAQQKIGGKP